MSKALLKSTLHARLASAVISSSCVEFTGANIVLQWPVSKRWPYFLTPDNTDPGLGSDCWTMTLNPLIEYVAL